MAALIAALRCPSMGPRLRGHPTLWPPPTSESAPEACAAPLPTSPGPGPVALPGRYQGKHQGGTNKTRILEEIEELSLSQSL